MPWPYRRVGRIVRPHGKDGEVSVALGDGLPLSSLAGLAVWVVPPPASGATARRVLSARSGPKGPILALEGVGGMEDAHELAGRWLLARTVDVPEVPEDVRSLAGFAVIDEKRGELGAVADIIVTGANDVLVVEGGPFGEVLVPVIDEVVLAIEEDEKQVRIRLLEGLIDGEA